MEAFIFHLAPTSHYQSFDDPEWYWPDEFEKEGFIHCCYENQIDDIIDRYFKESSNILSLKIMVASLKAEVKVEKAPVGTYYPHIYGKINRGAIVETKLVKG